MSAREALQAPWGHQMYAERTLCLFLSEVPVNVVKCKVFFCVSLEREVLKMH